MPTDRPFSPGVAPGAPDHPAPRCNVLGVGVHATRMEDSLRRIEAAVVDGTRGYVCVTGVHGVMEAQRDPRLREILNRALLNVPDGMPLVWVGKRQGFRDIGRVYGPDLMAALCERSVARGTSHFFYGGAPGVAEDLRERMVARFPGLRVVGTYTPPFRPLEPPEEQALQDLVGRLKPDLFWVGLSTPKQERFMAAFLPRLDTRIMLGVGAAFDLHTARIKDAPAWMKQAGLQWLHRLVHEPRRLWKRYLLNNPLFLVRITGQFLGARTYPL